mmetsp:Transcript_50577/g.90338  ORF Transcript_50577/g.90338 Transcript_50577/m.90338 type:complete len:362 (-) Transcript_50577:7-1092(-)
MELDNCPLNRTIAHVLNNGIPAATFLLHICLLDDPIVGEQGPDPVDGHVLRQERRIDLRARLQWVSRGEAWIPWHTPLHSGDDGQPMSNGDGVILPEHRRVEIGRGLDGRPGRGGTHRLGHLQSAALQNESVQLAQGDLHSLGQLIVHEGVGLVVLLVLDQLHPLDGTTLPEHSPDLVLSDPEMHIADVHLICMRGSIRLGQGGGGVHDRAVHTDLSALEHFPIKRLDGKLRCLDVHKVHKGKRLVPTCILDDVHELHGPTAGEELLDLRIGGKNVDVSNVDLGHRQACAPGDRGPRPRVCTACRPPGHFLGLVVPRRRSLPPLAVVPPTAAASTAAPVTPLAAPVPATAPVVTLITRHGV